MPYPELNRRGLRIRPLHERHSKVDIVRDHVPVDVPATEFLDVDTAILAETVSRIRQARAKQRPVIVAFGAHTIKNGLGSVLSRLMETGWITHLATNGAGIIHDWEFAFQGKSSEDVRANVAAGQFGIWHETGYYINLALLTGAWEGLGYGEAVGAMIHRDALSIPSTGELEKRIRAEGAAPAVVAAAADLLGAIRETTIEPGMLAVPHPYKACSVQGNAFRLGIPFTGHPMFGHDIIYCHPMSHGAAIGRTAERDFLAFAAQIQHLEGGVYLSIGSAVMSPMIFEKSLSMARNLEMQDGRRIEHFFVLVVDLAPDQWNWQRDGEPPMDHPAYYLRYCKTFSRMGGEMRYLSCDNRRFLCALLRELEPIRDPSDPGDGAPTADGRVPRE